MVDNKMETMEEEKRQENKATSSDISDYKIIKEGEAEILMIAKNEVFYNKAQVHNKALQAPGRAISVAVSRLKDKLDDSAYKILMDYHTATVALLALMSAATGDDEDCSSDRVLTKRELLEGLMPGLKGLVLSPSQS